MNLLRILVFPFALLYGLIMVVRNKMFDWGWLPSETFNVPVITVGNITTGGTGKTPHVEFLAEMLTTKHYKVAVLSRGYKRKTKGYVLATKQSKLSDIGDEPFQLYKKFDRDIVLAVDEKRRRGIKNILKSYPDIDVIILDDAFQHRYVKPALNLLLTDYYNLFTQDFILPTGNLREFRSSAKRADLVIVTKTPYVFSPIDKDIMLKELRKFEGKSILFSYIDYGKLQPANSACQKNHPTKIKTVILLTGIANPASLEEYIKRISKDLYTLKYPDHHKYTEKDIEEIAEYYEDIFSGDKAIVTTEKDLMRLKDPRLMDLLSEIPLYYIPIKVKFHENGEKELERIVMGLLNEDE